MNPGTELTLAAALLAGLAGSPHCAAMCGPLLGLACGKRTTPTAKTSWLPLGCMYNAGRIASYSAAGALAAALGAAGLALRPGPMAQQLVALAMGLALIVLAAYVAGWSALAHAIEAAGSVLWRRIEPYARALAPADAPGRAFVLGLAWGWLPCGMVYVALLAALATADPLHGAMLMAAFGLGTLPALAAVCASRTAFARWAKSRRARALAAAVIGAAGIAGVVRALQAVPPDSGWCLGIPSLVDLVQTWL